MGDPGGIGPEVIVRAARRPPAGARLAVFASPGVLERAARACGMPVPRSLEMVPCGAPVGRPVQGPTAAGGRAALACLEAATAAVLAGRCAALVTAPLSKGAISRAGCPHPGHTEFLRERTGARDAVMMLAGGGLRVALVTIHVPISDLPRLVRRARVLRCLRVLDADLRGRFGIAAPRIGVCGLNPHAGEGGLFGREDRREIRPAISRANRLGIRAEGPLAADGLFPRARRGEYDAVLAMYHDQGLGPLKAVAFDEGVNVTLGLPIIRTSPDHGTAYDIAGRGIARSGAMEAAIRLAAALASRAVVGQNPRRPGGRRGQDQLL